MTSGEFWCGVWCDMACAVLVFILLCRIGLRMWEEKKTNGRKVVKEGERRRFISGW